MSNILPGLVPLQTADDCIESLPVNCGKQGVSSDEVASNYQIEFPRNESKLLLGGGAVISIDAQNLKLYPSPNVANILTKNFNVLQGLDFENNLEDLVKSRTVINNALFDVARKDLKVVDENNGKKRAPSIYFSVYKGSDSTIVKDGIFTPEMIRVCEFRYIPVESFSRILNNLITENNPEFGEAVGVSGRSYDSLKSLANDLTEKNTQIYNNIGLPNFELPSFPLIGGNDPDIVDLVLEFFPIVNISEDSLSSQKNDPIIGGYYTLLNGKIYLKMPDLTGRNSSGESSGLITVNSSLWFEVLVGSTISRLEILDFKMPPLASFVGSQQDEFPIQNNLEIIFELAEDDQVTVYLSPIVKNISTSKNKSLNFYSNSIEYYSVPMLNKPIQSNSGRLPTINLDDIVYSGQYDSQIYFGEKNRPDVLLSSDGVVDNKNENKYYSISSYGALDVLNSIRPKYYENIPLQWISATPTKDLNDNYIATFNASNFSTIDLSQFGGTIEYAVYVGDSSGQITKINGSNIKLSDSVPAITSIFPDGFNGTNPIILSDPNIIQINGEDLGGVKQVIFTGQDNGIVIPFIPGDGVMSTPTDTKIVLDFSNQTMISRGITSAQAYTVNVQGSSSNLISQDDEIFIVNDRDDFRPIKGKLLTRFKENEISSSDFSFGLSGIPLFKNGQNAKINLKSKSKIFNGDRDVFAYLALPTTELDKFDDFSFPEDVITITTPTNTVLVSKNIEYLLENNILGDFYKSPISNRKATLNFPGNKYSGYNFSKLLGIKKAYILFTGRSISELVGSGKTLSLTQEDHSILELGNNIPAFIEPAGILGYLADVGGSYIYSSFTTGTYSIPEDVFGTTNFSPQQINVYSKINRLGLIISGTKEKFLRKRYSFKLGGIDINDKISREPIQIDSEKILFVFDDIQPSVDGILDFTIDKKEKFFGTSYLSSGYNGQATAIINQSPGELYEIDVETGILTLNSDISADILIDNLSAFIEAGGVSGIIGKADNLTNKLQALIPDTIYDSLIFDPRTTVSDNIYKPFISANITSNQLIEISVSADNLNELTILYPGIKEENVTALQKSVLNLKSGSAFSSKNYILNEANNSLLLFFGIKIDGLSALKYNVPEVVSIGEDEQDPILLSSGEEISLKVGKKYKVKVKNTDRDFIIKMDEIVLKPRGRPETTENPGEYIAIIEAPSDLLLKQDCFEICASTENSIRNRAKFSLGRDFVVDLDEIFQDMLTGPLKDKIPDIPELFDKLTDFPLRFAQLKFDKANIPKDLIKSFCDLSFHLMAELKISLNGFSVLMIPVQVIFCIIDVICSLLNPVKVAKAVIRLFQCLYDLILLLPVISVPVMFLQLILHLLELLKCVIDKILFTITAINEIARAINLAAQKPFNFQAIKALEETLSEYLFEIDADLSFLEPILSILAIFLQLLQLIFRFPCNINPGGGQSDCGVDGTLLAGIIAGIAAPDLEIIPGVMIPVAQTYSTDDVEGNTESINLSEASVGKIIATNLTDTFLDSMVVDQDSLRGTASGTGLINFNATLAPTFTKSKKKGGRPNEVEFQFKSNGLSTFLNKKNIDPNQTVDSPLGFFSVLGNQLVVSSNGNLYSPIDGETFLTISGSTASVKPLILNLEIPTFENDPDTGIPVQTGTENVTRTFDNIPMMVIMDDEFNVYFIKDNGIEFNSDGFVEKITAEIVNTVSAPKMKFSREEVEIDTNDDSTDDEGTIKVFDFPQLYFFDVRQAGDQLQQFCSTASINSFPFEDNNTDDIQTIISDSQTCLQNYLNDIRGMVSSLRESQQSGVLPLPEISVSMFNEHNETLISCLSNSSDQICKYVINGLNTSFKIIEDVDLTPLNNFTAAEPTTDILGDFEAIGPAFTGAREYAAGIGDSATISVNDIANIEIIPRDSYDEEIIGDLTDKISIDIISDTTGTAEFIRDDNNNIFTKNGTSYFAKLTAKVIGEVKIKARICDRTIQALTYDGIDNQDDFTTETNCVDDSVSEIINTSAPLGALTKVDRILTVNFIKASNQNNISNIDTAGGNELPITTPQVFGSGLVN